MARSIFGNKYNCGRKGLTYFTGESRKGFNRFGGARNNNFEL